MNEIILHAILAIFLISTICAPLGPLAIWQKLSFVGDALAHAALLGVAVALGLEFPPILGMIVVSAIVGGYLVLVDERKQAVDASLVVLAYGGLAGALALSSLLDVNKNLLESYLFGDILSISRQDIIVLLGAVVFMLFVIRWRWERFLLMTLNRELAAAHQIDFRRERLIFIGLLSAGIAIAIKAFGAILVGAIFIIPALSVRLFSKSPEQMVLLSFFASITSGIAGLAISWQWDVPTGPAIILASLFLLLMSRLIGYIK